MKEECNKINTQVEEYLVKSCKQKVNSLKSCEGEKADCSCSSSLGETSSGVDLVILVDSSGSMYSTWQAITDASGGLDQAIKDTCGIETRITKLFLDTKGIGSTYNGAASGTLDVSLYPFISHEKYIIDQTGFTGPFLTNDTPSMGTHEEGEQGSRGIADVSNHFPWKEGACRSILYISDEWLDSGIRGSIHSNNSIPIAVDAANNNNVTVFTHLVDSGYGSQSYPTSHPEIDNQYVKLAEATGGQAHIGNSPSPELYKELVSNAACNCKKGCPEIEVPEIKPCITISWGDSSCDGIETDDFEILCISVCNCYSNISFNNFNINMIEITDEEGNVVPTLPDGTPSVQAVPIGPICFGTIKACEDGESTCVSREFVINTRGAKDGEYQVKLNGICFDVNFNYHQESCFKFKLCKS